MWRNDGSAMGSYWAGSVPNITGTFNISNSAGTQNRLTGWIVSGAFGKTSLSYNDVCGVTAGSGTNTGGRVTLDASRSSGIYDSNNTGQVFPANKKMYYIIKY